MTTRAGGIASKNGTAAKTPRDGEAISRLSPWPPPITWSFGRSAVAAAADTLVEIEWMKPADGTIGLRLCNSEGQEYGVELSLPPPLVEAAAQLFTPGMTLAEIGKIDVAATHAATEKPAIDTAAAAIEPVPSAVEP